MAIHKKDEPGFWRIGPSWLSAIQDQADAQNAGFAMFCMTDDPESDRTAPMAAAFYMPPGYVLPEHAHDCHRVEVVVQGSIQLPDGTILRPGDVSVSRPGEFYGPHIAGPEGATSMEIFSSAMAVDPTFAQAADAEFAAQFGRDVDTRELT